MQSELARMPTNNVRKLAEIATPVAPVGVPALNPSILT
jgi:hypothetical protein